MDTIEDWRYSVCIVHADRHGERTYCKYYRVADYLPQGNPGELIPALIQKDATSPEDEQANPDHLYNPSAAYNHESRDSDFYLFRWKQNPREPGKKLTQSFHDDVSLLAVEAREVILLEDRKGENGLKDALSEGIPFEGKTTNVFYIAYDDEDSCHLAIRCRRQDLSFSEDRIRLRNDISSVKDTVLSAPRVRLNDCDIIESPHAPTAHRKVYAKLDEPETDGSVLLRPLNYYAADYVKWFMKRESLDASKSDKRKMSKIIDTAFMCPDALEVYLEAGAPEKEIRSFGESLARTVMESDDPVRKLFRDALLEDEGFYEECLEQVIQSSDSLLQERNSKLKSIETSIEDSQSTLADLTRSIENLSEEKRSIESDIASISAELKRARNEREAVLDEIQSNIALRLGLRAVAPQPVTANGPGLPVKAGSFYDCTDSNSSFKEIIAGNLKKLGVTSMIGTASAELEKLAVGIIGALAATKFLAIPQALARQVADSISVAISGYGAKKITVPADFRDISSILNQISEEDAVVIVDGVIDSVNEGVLFALLSENGAPVVVLPFMSHASASLIAKEAWGMMYLPNVGSLLPYPRPTKCVKLQKMTSAPELPMVSIDDALDEAKTLGDELAQPDLHATHLLLAAIVSLAIEELTDEDRTERFVAQHLLMCSRRDQSAYEIAAEWSEADPGLTELAKKLGIYGQ